MSEEPTQPCIGLGRICFDCPWLEEYRWLCGRLYDYYKSKEIGSFISDSLVHIPPISTTPKTSNNKEIGGL